MKRTGVAAAILAAVAFACQAHAGPTLTGRILRTDPEKAALVVRPEKPDGSADGNLVTVATDANTRVTIDGRTSVAAKLATNMRVVISPSQGTAASIRATVPANLIGKVFTADANSLVVLDGNVAITVPLDAKTRVIVEGRPATRSDIRAGVLAKVVPGAGTAAEVETKTPPPSTLTVVGRIVSRNQVSRKIGILPRNGRQVTLGVDTNTRLTVNGKSVRFEALAPGMDVLAKYEGGVAKEIQAIAAPIRVNPPVRPSPGPTPLPPRM